MTLSINTPSGFISVPFLLDTGAQCSLVDYSMLKNLGVTGNQEVKQLNSLGFNKTVKGFQFDTQLKLPSSDVVDAEFFCIPTLSLNMTVPGITNAIAQLKSVGISLSTNIPLYSNDEIKIAGILGNDLLQKFKVFEIQDVLGGKMLRVSNGFVPIGCISSLFLELNNKINVNKRTVSAKNHTDKFSLKICNKFDCLDDYANVTDMNKTDFDLDNCRKNSELTSPAKFSCNLSKQKQSKSKIFRSSKKRKVIKAENSVDCDELSNSVNFVLNPQHSYFTPFKDVFPDSQVEHGLENLFSLESIGIKEENSSNYDEIEIENFRKSIALKNGKYHVDIPWNRDILQRVPSNFYLAKVMAKKVSARNGQLDDKYFEVFQEQKNLNIIEELPIPDHPETCIWIPHRPVIRQDPYVANTKIRPVFNCSLRIGNNPSLNDAGYPGKDLLNDLLGLVLYFRTNDYVLLADIAKAFLNIKLNKEADKNCFCFVVYYNNKFYYYRYSTIIFGYLASPFILNYIVQHHAQNCLSLTIKDILCNKFYVDNMVFTGNNINEIVQAGNGVSESLAGVGFNLREWNSNQSSILEHFDGSKILCDSKILGYLFHPHNDTLSLKKQNLNIDCKTKRDVVSSVASIFDPIGILSPLLLEFKLYIRKLCELKYGWDQVIPENELNLYRKYCVRLNEVLNSNSLSVCRKVARSDQSASLMVFTDASKESYGFVIYCLQDNISNLLFSKFKLTPVPPKTLPSLELLAIYLAVQCTLNIITNGNFHIPIKNITFLTDSQVALSWVLVDKVVKKNIFVSNRLKDLSIFRQKLINMGVNLQFTYVPSEHNIADILTKPISVSKFCKQKDVWFKGPPWLTLPKGEWPRGQLGCIPVSFRSDDGGISDAVIAMSLTGPVTNKKLPIIDINKYSSYSKLFSVTLTLFKAVKKFKGEVIDIVDLKKFVFHYLIEFAQNCCFSNEMEFLNNKPTNLKDVPKLVKNLNLFIDSYGILRSKGRISRNLSLSYDAVNPILLSPNHYLTSLIINDSHFTCKHLGVESTMNHLRQSGFWILNVRQSIKKIIKQCIICNKYNSRSFTSPPTPSLPKDRVNLVRPFYHTGIDFTGHFFVRDFSENKHKIYILLFTCMNTRAVHLETVNNMSVVEFVMAFVRFYNRYGLPKVLYSDNAKTFISGSSLLSNLIASDYFQQKFVKYDIVHKTIPTYSPWFGASWERLIKTIKQCLYKSLGRSTVDESRFVTSLSDIQLAINNRPLTYRDRDNSIEVVTPNHLISVGDTFPSLIIAEENILAADEEDIKISLLNALEYRDVVVNRFRKEWYNNYLLALREKHRDYFSPDDYNNSRCSYLRVGSVVLMKHPIKPRPFWSLGKIVELFPGEDGLTRVVKILKSDHTTIKTSITNLYPLELESEVSRNLDLVDGSGDGSASNETEAEELDEVSRNPVNSNSSQINEEQARPPRRAALKFKEKMANWLEADSI